VPALVAPLTLETLDRLRIVPRVIAPADASEAIAILRAALADGGVATEWRRGGLATAMLRAMVEATTRSGRALVALHTVADRDVHDPLPRAVRLGVDEDLARGVGMTIGPPSLASSPSIPTRGSVSCCRRAPRPTSAAGSRNGPPRSRVRDRPTPHAQRALAGLGRGSTHAAPRERSPVAPANQQAPRQPARAALPTRRRVASALLEYLTLSRRVMIYARGLSLP
jgi:hypothetical protein